MISTNIYITPSEVIEYLFCPRFIYYMNCLGIKQKEGKRFEVIMGRKVHKYKSSINKKYLRKNLGCIDKKIEVKLHSKSLQFKGIVDEILTLDNDTMAPLDYKYAEYSKSIFKTLKYQSVIYAMLIEKCFDRKVNKGYICYVRSDNYLKEIKITKRLKNNAIKYKNEILKIIKKGYYPKATNYKKRCIDCTYKNICIQ